MYLTKNRFGAYLICYRDGDGKKHHIYSHTRIKKEACGKFFKFNIPKEPNRKPDYKSILAIPLIRLITRANFRCLHKSRYICLQVEHEISPLLYQADYSRLFFRGS